MGLRKLVEDALRIKFVRNDKEFDGIPITKNKEDLAQRQIEQADSGSLLDSEAIQKFRTLSNNRQEKYAEYEEMLSDATIAASIEMYADDSTQYNFRTGKILWVESEDADIAAAIFGAIHARAAHRHARHGDAQRQRQPDEGRICLAEIGRCPLGAPGDFAGGLEILIARPGIP